MELSCLQSVLQLLLCWQISTAKHWTEKRVIWYQVWDRKNFADIWTECSSHHQSSCFCPDEDWTIQLKCLISKLVSDSLSAYNKCSCSCPWNMYIIFCESFDITLLLQVLCQASHRHWEGTEPDDCFQIHHQCWEDPTCQYRWALVISFAYFSAPT